MSSPQPPDSFDETELDDLQLSDEWVGEAATKEDTAQARAERYARIHHGHQNATAPRSWTPAEQRPSSDPQMWVKVTAIVLIVIAALAVLSLVRAWG